MEPENTPCFLVGKVTCPVRLRPRGTAVAAFAGVMATVFRIRFLLTVRLLELALRVAFLVAIFTRPSAGRMKALARPPL
jgi:hypothetical protein